MPEKYYQEYGPISRRRANGEQAPDDRYEPPEREPPAQESLVRELPDRELPRRRYGAQRRQRRRGSLLRLFFGLLICIAVALALPYTVSVFAGDQAMDGVSLRGQPVSGMQRDAIREMLQQRYASFMRAPLTVTFEGRTWTPTLEQLGARLDIDRAADDAVAAGHQGGPDARARELWALWQGGLDMAPRLSVDLGSLHAYLISLAPDVERPPRDAALSIAKGQVLPTPAQPGRQILVDATALDILRALQTLDPQQVVLRTRTLDAALGDAALAKAAAEAGALLDEPLLLRHERQEWLWGPEKIAELLAVRSAHGGMTVTIDPDRLVKAVARLSQVVDSPSVEPQVAFRGGKLTILQEGQPGWRLRQNEAVEAISATLRLPTRALALPVERITPQVTAKSLSTLGIVELVGEGKTSYAGSAAYRVTNIKAGIARMNGVLIPPDAVFSFNTQIGAIDETNGFVQGYAVIGNRTQLEWGGGVCQVSTTVFRAAFWSGLPIVERHTHPFYISWYDAFAYPDGRSGPGMDATIFTGVLDFRFKNDTGRWLLMEAAFDDAAETMTVRLYGTKPNRVVNTSGPEITRQVAPPSQPVYVDDATLAAGTVKQTDYARKGMDIAVYRVITEDGAQRPPELFFTRFKPWPDVFVRGTKP